MLDRGCTYPRLRQTNVQGTQNVIEACEAAGVKRLVYISSVHAILVPDAGPVVEADQFDPALCWGYGEDQGGGDRRVLAATGLDRVVIHPTGLIGPGDCGDSALTRLIRDMAGNWLPALTAGGHDFVDVRDVAIAALRAARHAPNGRCYLVGGHWMAITEIACLVREREQGSRVPGSDIASVGPTSTPLVGLLARIRHARPPYTRYSLHTPLTPVYVDSSRARRELGHDPRPLADTIADTVDWVRQHPAGPAIF